MRLKRSALYVAFLFNISAWASNVGELSQKTASNVGCFWHLTDIHWDPNYESRDNNCLRGGKRVPEGMFGEHSCDSPWSLVQSAAHAMLESTSEDVEFILWTGDGVTNSRSANKTAALLKLTNLLSHVFTSHFVFPVLGHDDPEAPQDSDTPYQVFCDMWKHWLPSEALVTFCKGGYYTIERKRTKLRLVALNTNLCTGSTGGSDPAGQWAWLEAVLAKSKLQNETVYLVGHVPPGVDERVGLPPRPAMTTPHNTRYIHLIRQYADIITGQFFGHLHSDTFRIVYSEAGAPVSRLFLAPSLTPRRSTAGFNNPGTRLYKIDIDTGQVLDYSQFYLDLTAANQERVANWTLLYTLNDYYGFQQGTAEEFHDLAEKFTTPEGVHLFTRYLQANSVFSSGPPTNMAGGHAHYCAVTKLDYTEYQNCLATAAAALAASTAPSPQNSSAPYPYHPSILPLLQLLPLLPLALS